MNTQSPLPYSPPGDVGGLTNQQCSYIVRKPCGCILAAMQVDVDPRYMANGAIYERWVKDGLMIEMVPNEYVKENWKTCPHFQRGWAHDLVDALNKE